MYNASHNRYELLFLDDEDCEPAPPAVSASQPVKQTKQSMKRAAKRLAKMKLREVSNKPDILKNTVEKDDEVDQNVPVENGYGKYGYNENSYSNVNSSFHERKATVGETKEVARGMYGEAQPSRQFNDRGNRGQVRNHFTGNNFRGGKRNLERNYGSDKIGIKAVDKRDGADTNYDELVKPEIEEIHTTEIDEVHSDKEELGKDVNVEPEVILPKVVKEMTLDEWKAKKGQREKPKFNIRKPGEGEDNSQWPEMVALEKKSNGGGEELEYDQAMYPQRVGRLRHIVDIQYNFMDDRQNAGYERGRGRARFGAKSVTNGTKAKKSIAANQNSNGRTHNFGEPLPENFTAPKVDDEHQFPILN